MFFMFINLTYILLYNMHTVKKNIKVKKPAQRVYLKTKNLHTHKDKQSRSQALIKYIKLHIVRTLKVLIKYITGFYHILLTLYLCE